MSDYDPTIGVQKYNQVAPPGQSSQLADPNFNKQETWQAPPLPAPSHPYQPLSGPQPSDMAGMHDPPSSFTGQYVPSPNTTGNQSSVNQGTLPFGNNTIPQTNAYPAPPPAGHASSTSTTYGQSPRLAYTPAEEAERHRNKAEMAHRSRLESHAKWKDDSSKFKTRFAAAGTTVMKWIEEKKHGNKADRYEREDMTRKLKEAKESKANIKHANKHPPPPNTGMPPPPQMQSAQPMGMHPPQMQPPAPTMNTYNAPPYQMQQ
jgi:hypothetical protein